MNDHTTAGQVITLTVAQVAQHPENIRDAGRDITALAESIRAGGIRTPLLVALIDGHEFPAEITHVAIDGNRRVAAARQLGDDIALPCIVRDDLADRRETIRTMAITGLARDGLTTAETVAAVQTMLDLGLTQTAVAKDTGLATKTVRAAKKAAQLITETAELAAEYELTLDQLATLTDWDHDEEATSDLLAAANTGRWDHTLARLTRDRKNQQAKAQLIADLTSQGLRVIEDRPSLYQAPIELEAITDQDGQPLTDQTHASCPGHAIAVTQTWSGELDTVAVCTDPAANGHHCIYTRSGNDNSGTGPVTEQEQEQQRQARRELVARNKEMLAAQDVRRQFLRTTVNSRKHAKTMTEWATARLVARDYTVQNLYSYGPNQVLAELLDTQDLRGHTATLPVTRHPGLLRLTVCAAYEAALPKDAHRSPTTDQAAYLTHLIALGYTPCETEQLLITATTDAE